MKLLRLLPDQIMSYWEQIKPGIVDALPPFIARDEENLIRIQESLLLSKLDCWVATEDNNQICAIMTTRVIEDDISGARNVLIYTLKTLSSHSDRIWVEGYEGIRKYASSRNCSGIIAYTNQARVISVAEALGADCSWRLMEFPA